MNDIWRDLLHVRADATLAIGLLLAVCVTIHILLRKREVASAVGWIGLVWFAPILGAIGYLLFGVNRVRRRARQLRPQDDDPDGPPAGRSHAGRRRPGSVGPRHRPYHRPSAAGGNVVRIYQNGDEAYPPMLAAIAAAKSSVGLSSYIFRGRSLGRPLHRGPGRRPARAGWRCACSSTGSAAAGCGRRPIIDCAATA